MMIDPIISNISSLLLAAEPAGGEKNRKYQLDDFSNEHLLKLLKDHSPAGMQTLNEVNRDNIVNNIKIRDAVADALYTLLEQLEKLINTKQKDKAEKIINKLQEIAANKNPKHPFSLLSFFLQANIGSSTFFNKIYLPLLIADLNIAKIEPEDTIAARLVKTSLAIAKLNQAKVNLDQVFLKDVKVLGSNLTTGDEKLLRSTAIRFFARIHASLAVAHFIQGNLHLSEPEIERNKEDKFKVSNEFAAAWKFLGIAYRFATKGDLSGVYKDAKDAKKDKYAQSFIPLIDKCAFPEGGTPAKDCESTFRYSAGDDLVNYELILRPYQLQLIKTALTHYESKIQSARSELNSPLDLARKVPLTKTTIWPSLADVEVSQILKAVASLPPTIIAYFDKEYEETSLNFELGARNYDKSLLNLAWGNSQKLLKELNDAISRPETFKDENERKETIRQLEHLRLKYRVLEYKVQIALAEDFEDEIIKIEKAVINYKQQVLVDAEIKGDFENLNELDLVLADAKAGYFYLSTTKGKADINLLKEALQDLEKAHQEAIKRNGQDIAQIRLRIQVKKAKLLQAALSYFSLDELKTIAGAQTIIKTSIPETLASIKDNLLQSVDQIIEAMPLLKLELRGTQIENAALSYFLATDPDKREKSLTLFFEIYASRTDDFAPRQDLWLYKMLSAITGRLTEEKVRGYFNLYLKSGFSDILPADLPENEKKALLAIKAKLDGYTEDGKPIKGLIKDTQVLPSKGKPLNDENLISDLTKINREARLFRANTNLSLSSLAYDQKDFTASKEFLAEARDETSAILDAKERDFASAATLAEAHQMLVKTDQARLGQLISGDAVAAGDFNFFAGARKISSEADLIAFQKEVQENIKKALEAPFNIQLNCLKKFKGVNESVVLTYQTFDQMGESLFPQIGKYGFYQTLADTDLNLAYLNFDTGNIKAFRGYYAKAFERLNKVLKAEVSGATRSAARLSLAGFLNAVSGDHEEFVNLQTVKDYLPSLKIDFSLAGVLVENQLLLAGRGLVEEAKKDRWFSGKAAIQTEHTYNSLSLRLLETWSKLTSHRPPNEDDLPRKIVYDYSQNKYIHEASLPEVAYSSQRLLAALSSGLSYFNADEKAKAGQIISLLNSKNSQLMRQALKTFYQQFLNLKPLQADIEKTKNSRRGDLSAEASLLYQESRVFDAARQESLKETQKIMRAALLELKDIDPQSDLVKFLRQRMLADVYKVLGSLEQDLTNYERKGDKRICAEAETLFEEAKKNASYVKDNSARLGLKAQSEIILGDLDFSKAGQNLDPKKELKELDSAEKTYQRLLSQNFENDPNLPVIIGQTRQNLKKSLADTYWRMGLLYRQINGRKSKEANEYFEKAGALYGDLKKEQRTDLYASSQFNLLFIDFIRLGDDITTDLKQFKKKLEERKGKLLEIHNQLAQIAAENTFFGREFLSAHLLLANAQTQLEMMEYVLKGKQKTSEEFMQNLKIAYGFADYYQIEFTNASLVEKLNRALEADAYGATLTSAEKKVETAEKVAKNDKLDKFITAYKDKYRYDDTAKTLVVKGKMSEEEKNDLLAIYSSSEEKEVINRLFHLSQVIGRLNELLETPGFFELWTSKNKKTILTESENAEIKRLTDATKKYRNKPFAELSEPQKTKIKLLNRLLIEATYPTLSPKRMSATFTRLSEDDVLELNLERDINILGLNLATCTDGKKNLPAQAALEEIINDIQGNKNLINDPNHSGRTLLELSRLGMEANIRIGLFATDSDNWGKKKGPKEDDKTIIVQMPAIVELIKENKTGQQALLDKIKPLLDQTVSKKADNYFLRALQYGVPLIYSGRKDLEAQGNYWLSQLMLAIALDEKDRLNTADDFADKALEPEELEGENLLRARMSKIKVKTAKTGLEKDSLNPYHTLGTSTVHGIISISEATDLIEALDDPKLPKQWNKLLGEIKLEIAELYNWHSKWHGPALDYYSHVKTLLENSGVLESFYYKIKARAFIGKGDIYKNSQLRNKNPELAEENYFMSFEPLEIKPADVKTAVEKILDEAKKGQSAGQKFMAVFDLSNNSACKKFFAENIFSKGDPNNKTESQRTILARAFLGLASLYGENIWEKGIDRDRARVYLALARQTLSSIHTPLAQHRQIDRQIYKLEQSIGSAAVPQFADMSYNFSRNDKLVPPPRNEFRLKLNYPFNVKWGPLSDPRIGLDLRYSNYLPMKVEPVITGGVKLFNSSAGVLDLSAGFGAVSQSAESSLAYNFRNIVSAFAAYENQPVKGGTDEKSFRAQSFFGAVSLRPYVLMHEGLSHAKYLRHLDIALLDKVLDGATIGTSYSIFHERTANPAVSLLSDTKLFDRYKGVSYLDAGWSSWMFRDYIYVSFLYKHPLTAHILSGNQSAFERLSKDTVFKYSPDIWQFSLAIDPHLPFKLNKTQIMPLIRLDGSFQQIPHPIEENRKTINYWTWGATLDFMLF